MVEMIDLTLCEDDNIEDNEAVEVAKAEILLQIKKKVHEIKSNALDMSASAPFHHYHNQTKDLEGEMFKRKRRTRFGGYDEEYLNFNNDVKTNEIVTEFISTSPYPSPTMSVVNPPNENKEEDVPDKGPTTEASSSKKRPFSRFGGFNEEFLVEEKEATLAANLEGSCTPGSIWSSAWSISSPTNSFDDSMDDFHVVIHQDNESESDHDAMSSVYIPRTPIASSVGQRSPALSTATYFMDDSKSVASHAFSIPPKPTDYAFSSMGFHRRKHKKSVSFKERNNCCKVFQEFQPTTGSLFVSESDKIVMIAREQLDKHITGGRDSAVVQKPLSVLDEDEMSYRMYLTTTIKTRFQQQIMQYLSLHRNKMLSELNVCELQLMSYDQLNPGKRSFQSECMIMPKPPPSFSTTEDNTASDEQSSLNNYELVLIAFKSPAKKLDENKTSLHSLCRSPVFLGIVDSERWTQYHIFANNHTKASPVPQHHRYIYFEAELYQQLKKSGQTQRFAQAFLCIPLFSCSIYLRSLHLIPQLSRMSILPHLLIGSRSITAPRLREFMTLLGEAARPPNKKPPKKAEVLRLLRNLQAVPIDLKEVQRQTNDQNLMQEVMKSLEDIRSLHLSLEVNEVIQEVLQKCRILFKTWKKNVTEQEYELPAEVITSIPLLIKHEGTDNNMIEKSEETAEQEHRRMADALELIAKKESNIGLHDISCFHGSSWHCVEDFVKYTIHMLVQIRKDITFRKLQRHTLIVVALDQEDALQALHTSLTTSTANRSSTNPNNPTDASRESSSSKVPLSTVQEESSFGKIKTLMLREELDKKVNLSTLVRKHSQRVLALHQQCTKLPEITKQMKIALQHPEDESTFWSSREKRSDALVAYHSAKWKTPTIRNQARLEILDGTQVLLATFEELNNPSFLKFMEDNKQQLQCPAVISIITKSDILEGSCLLPLTFDAKKWIVVEQVTSSSSEPANSNIHHCAMVQRWKNLGIESTCIDIARTTMKGEKAGTQQQSTSRSHEIISSSPEEDSTSAVQPIVPHTSPPSQKKSVRKQVVSNTIETGEEEEFDDKVYEEALHSTDSKAEPQQRTRLGREIQAPIKYLDNNVAKNERLLSAFDQAGSKPPIRKRNKTKSLNINQN